MVQTGNKLMAASGFSIVRKSDGIVMGTVLYLGEGDSANNYEERPAGQEPPSSFGEDTLADALIEELGIGKDIEGGMTDF